MSEEKTSKYVVTGKILVDKELIPEGEIIDLTAEQADKKRGLVKPVGAVKFIAQKVKEVTKGSKKGDKK